MAGVKYEQLDRKAQRRIRDETQANPPNADAIRTLEEEHYQLSYRLRMGLSADPAADEYRMRDIENEQLPRARGET